MIIIRQGVNLADPAISSMFEDRKRLFVDLLHWNVPVAHDRFEIDSFDGGDAIYLIVLSDAGDHIGSIRLLPTDRPHLLDTLFASLCEGSIPAGKEILEITRLCLPTRLGAAKRLQVRNQLISTMVDYALERGIVSLTGVVTWDFLEQIMAMGWRCAPLGKSVVIDRARLGAFKIELDEMTRPALAENAIYACDSVRISLAA